MFPYAEFLAKSIVQLNQHHSLRYLMNSSNQSRYLENETLFFLQIKKFINCTLRATLLQKIVLQRRQPLRVNATMNKYYELFLDKEYTCFTQSSAYLFKLPRKIV